MKIEKYKIIQKWSDDKIIVLHRKLDKEKAMELFSKESKGLNYTVKIIKYYLHLKRVPAD